MKKLVFLFLFSSTLCCKGQSFNRSIKDQVKVPRSVVLQLTAFLKKHENYPVMPEMFTRFRVFNVLHPTQKNFTDGLYYFIYGSHDSGTLFINRKNKITVFKNGPTAEMLANYAAYLEQNHLAETTQLDYLAAIAAFMKYRYKDQKELVKSGALQELK